MKIVESVLIESITFDKLPINPSVLSLVDYIKGGGDVPPIKLQLNGNGGYKLKDGRHRLCAFKLLGYTEIKAKFSNNYINSGKQLIRTEVMNLTLSQWEKVEKIEKFGFIEVTPKELIDLIGFDGGMFFSGKTNELENKFIKSFYKMGRTMTSSF